MNTDRCAGCFAVLVVAPSGSRYACLKCTNVGYWSEAIPEAGKLADVVLRSKHGKPTLYYYGNTGGS